MARDLPVAHASSSASQVEPDLGIPNTSNGTESFMEGYCPEKPRFREMGAFVDRETDHTVKKALGVVRETTPPRAGRATGKWLHLAKRDAILIEDPGLALTGSYQQVHASPISGVRNLPAKEAAGLGGRHASVPGRGPLRQIHFDIARCQQAASEVAA